MSICLHCYSWRLKSGVSHGLLRQRVAYHCLCKPCSFLCYGDDDDSRIYQLGILCLSATRQMHHASATHHYCSHHDGRAAGGCCSHVSAHHVQTLMAMLSHYYCCSSHEMMSYRHGNCYYLCHYHRHSDHGLYCSWEVEACWSTTATAAASSWEGRLTW